MSRFARALGWSVALAVIPILTFGQEWNSGPTRMDVVELYTSEGCSSCPPADRWLSTLKEDPELFEQFVPMAFHVDYWDYIGWKDRFASPAFSERQRQYVREGLVSQSYTPGIVVNSGEWRQWFAGKRRWENARETVGSLDVTLDDQGQLSATFDGRGAGKLHVAVLGMGLTTRVRAGENRGRGLNHDFVVLKMQSHPGTTHWNLPLPAIPDAGQSRTALAVWVSAGDSQKIIQAVGGYLPFGSSR